MASDTAYSPSPPPPSAAVPLDNHRKRRRNRTRVSCLNCYASKRKCDRKRPCTRCIKHGLTGLCFYELDDPAAPDSCDPDETARLRRRIAELESVVRAMNNRPHPRWTAPDGLSHRPASASTRPRAADREVDAFFAREADVKVKLEPEPRPPVFTPSDSERGSPAPPAYNDDPAAAAACASPFGSPLTPLLSDVFDADDHDHDHDAAPIDLTYPADQGSSSTRPHAYASAAVQTHCASPAPAQDCPCPCLSAATLHSPLVYFASALRTSREALEASHAAGSSCTLLRRITELDDHIFSVAPAPSPMQEEEEEEEEDTRVLCASLPPSPPALPPLQLSPYQFNHHPDAFAFLDSTVCPALFDWPP